LTCRKGGPSAIKRKRWRTGSEKGTQTDPSKTNGGRTSQKLGVADPVAFRAQNPEPVIRKHRYPTKTSTDWSTKTLKGERALPRNRSAGGEDSNGRATEKKRKARKKKRVEEKGTMINSGGSTHNHWKKHMLERARERTRCSFLLSGKGSVLGGLGQNTAGTKKVSTRKTSEQRTGKTKTTGV